MKKILVYGAGAIGMTFGGYLSKEHEITLLGREKNLNAIKRNGLRISGIWGGQRFRRFKLASRTAQLEKRPGTYDLILVCVKSYDTLRAAREIARFAGSRTMVISLQNGLGNLETLGRFLRPENILAGRVIFGAVLQEPGHVEITVIASPTAVGESSRNEITSRVRAVVKMFRSAGLPSSAVKNVRTLLWAKAAFNCALNPLATLIGSHYGFLGEHEMTRLLMEEAIREVYRTARKMKVAMEPPAAASYIDFFYNKLLPSTYNHFPSMLQDIKRGKRTEIDAINGAIAAYAARAGVDVPVNRFLTKAVKELEK